MRGKQSEASASESACGYISMVIYPLVFHRRSARQWQRHAKAPAQSDDKRCKAQGNGCCPNCCLPVARPFVSAYLRACVVEHHRRCASCEFSWTSRFDPLLV